MHSKVPVKDLKVGMFVADLDRPWIDTPFPIQGFLIEDNLQIAELRGVCTFVMVDRARSTGQEYRKPEDWVHEPVSPPRQVPASGPSGPGLAQHLA